MKLIALLSAGALAAGTMMAAAPADAQRYGYDRGYGHHHDRDYDRGYDRHHHDWRRHDWRRGYYRGGYGYHRGRVVCRVHRGYYGPVRRCFRIYR